MSRYYRVASVKDLPTNSVLTVEVEGRRIALFNVDEEIHAVDNTCRVCGTVLGDAIVTETGVACPHHGWTLDLSQGSCPVSPEHKISIYPVKVDGDEIFVEL